MQESLNNYFNQNKKRLSVGEKRTLNKEKIISSEKKVNDDLTKEKAEEILKAFDLDPKYGPSRGISRMKRFQNAIRLNLNPPTRG